MKKDHPNIYESLYVGAKDRKYQFWERNPLSVPLFSQKVVEQKIKGKDEFRFLVNYMKI
ncbi:MAG: hypothetical protein IPM38_13665 [Ignavibacteria bacterium]|nr:hypothetical protein [Ignavibacteria bacterium]